MANTGSPSSQEKIWFITGSSSGFGRVLAELLLSLGEDVVATARNVNALKDLATKYPGNVRVLPLDVTSQVSVDSAVKEALARFGRIDVLVNNAGYGVVGGVEEVSEAEYDPMFQTNIFGLIRMTKAVLPQMRKQRSGNVVNISSIGGLIGGPGWGYYNATKFAVEGLSEALAAEVAPLGINVILIEPGPFRTEFLGRSGVMAKTAIADYESTVGKTREFFNTMDGKQPGDPQRAAQAIVEAVNAPQPPKHLILGKVALNRFRGKLDAWQQEIAQWESTTLNTDFPEDK